MVNEFLEKGAAGFGASFKCIKIPFYKDIILFWKGNHNAETPEWDDGSKILINLFVWRRPSQLNQISSSSSSICHVPNVFNSINFKMNAT